MCFEKRLTGLLKDESKDEIKWRRPEEWLRHGFMLKERTEKDNTARLGGEPNKGIDITGKKGNLGEKDMAE